MLEKRGDDLLVCDVNRIVQLPIISNPVVHPELPPHMHDLFDREERVTRVENDLGALEDLIRRTRRK